MCIHVNNIIIYLNKDKIGVSFNVNGGSPFSLLRSCVPKHIQWNFTKATPPSHPTGALEKLWITLYKFPNSTTYLNSDTSFSPKAGNCVFYNEHRLQYSKGTIHNSLIEGVIMSTINIVHFGGGVGREDHVTKNNQQRFVTLKIPIKTSYALMWPQCCYAHDTIAYPNWVLEE